MNVLSGKRVGSGQQHIATVRNAAGVSVTGSRVTDAFREHYARVGSTDFLPPVQFDNTWKAQVEAAVEQYSCIPDSATNSPIAAALNAPFGLAEITIARGQLKNGKAPSQDTLPNELLKYGGAGMDQLLLTLFNAMLRLETVPAQWRKGLIVNLFKGGDTADTDNYRPITLLCTVGKLFCRIINNRFVKHITLHEGQAGFVKGESCADNLYCVSEVLMQRHQQRTPTYALYLDVKKAFDTVWRDGLWYKLWHKGVQGKLWRLLQNMYAKTRSAVLVNGRPSAEFPVSQGTAQGCTLSPTLFDVFVDDLLESVQASGLGVEFAGSLLAALMFADDFIGLEGDPARLQALTDIAYDFCKKWRLAANVGKSAIVVYGSDSQSPVPIQQWKWGEAVIPVLDNYKYAHPVLPYPE